MAFWYLISCKLWLHQTTHRQTSVCCVQVSTFHPQNFCLLAKLHATLLCSVNGSAFTSTGRSYQEHKKRRFSSTRTKTFDDIVALTLKFFGHDTDDTRQRIFVLNVIASIESPVVMYEFQEKVEQIISYAIFCSLSRQMFCFFEKFQHVAKLGYIIKFSSGFIIVLCLFSNCDQVEWRGNQFDQNLGCRQRLSVHISPCNVHSVICSELTGCFYGN